MNRLEEAHKIMNSIMNNLEDFTGFIDEALWYFLVDVLDDDEFERAKQQVKNKMKSMYP